MKTIHLITSNQWKVESFSNILKKYDLPITIEMLNAEYVENKDQETTEWVVLDWAKVCAEKYNTSVLVQDTGLFIESLNGFPGVNTKFCLKRIGNDWLIKLMDWIENRDCSWIFSLWYCELGKEPVAFNWIVKWSIALRETWSDWFWFDPIFIPSWYEKTFAEDTDVRDLLSPFNTTIKELVNYLS